MRITRYGNLHEFLQIKHCWKEEDVIYQNTYNLWGFISITRFSLILRIPITFSFRQNQRSHSCPADTNKIILYGIAVSILEFWFCGTACQIKQWTPVRITGTSFCSKFTYIILHADSKEFDTCCFSLWNPEELNTFLNQEQSVTRLPNRK